MNTNKKCLRIGINLFDKECAMQLDVREKEDVETKMTRSFFLKRPNSCARKNTCAQCAARFFHLKRIRLT